MRLNNAISVGVYDRYKYKYKYKRYLGHTVEGECGSVTGFGACTLTAIQLLHVSGRGVRVHAQAEHRNKHLRTRRHAARQHFGATTHTKTIARDRARNANKITHKGPHTPHAMH